MNIHESMEKLAICTISSANYIAYAKTLFESAGRHEPTADLFLLVVDRKTPEIQAAVADVNFNVVFAEDLDIKDFELIAFKFDIVELNTALKPTMLKRIFKKGYEKVVYLDPDIRLFSDLSPVLNALDDNNIVFTPHSQVPVMDSYRPSDIDFMRTGVFNLGFLGLSASNQTQQMLDWWEERCLAYGFIDTSNGVFVDQKWMDLVPCYFDGVYVLKHLGCNVAYWNLHEREVSGRNGCYTVDGYPLCFFHFSGVKASQPDVLSRHQSRHVIVPGTTLAELVSDYCVALNENGHRNYQNLKYTFNDFDNGVSVNKLTRRAASFAVVDNSTPFSSKGDFYKFVKKYGLLAEENKKNAAMVSRDFDQYSKQVRIVNQFIRAAAFVIGSDRLSALIRYMVVLGREDNLSRVLSNTPLDFSHTTDKSRKI